MNKSHISKNEKKYIGEALKTGALQSGGKFTKLASEELCKLLLAKNVLLTPSASLALELCFWSLPANAEVIMPSYNFPSAASAVLRGGGRPVFCDINEGTQNAGLREIEPYVSEKTRAICLTHYAGISCEMDEIMAFAKEKNILVVEDAAQGIGAAYKGKALGTIGDMGVLSFHGTKNVNCGEGGAFIQKAGEGSFISAMVRAEKGTNRHDFLAGSAKNYSWEEMGSSIVLAELNSAMLLGQLEELSEIREKRLNLTSIYDECLKDLFSSGRLIKMQIPAYAENGGHMYYIRFLNEAAREKARLALLERDVQAYTHFVPLHMGGMGKRMGYSLGDFSKSEKAYQTLLRLPLHTGLSGEDIDKISMILKEVLA